MKKKVVLLVLILLILAGGAAFYFFSQPSKENLTDAEKKEALSELLGREVNLENETPQGNTKFEGKTISFSYSVSIHISNYVFLKEIRSQLITEFLKNVKYF